MCSYFCLFPYLLTRFIFSHHLFPRLPCTFSLITNGHSLLLPRMQSLTRGVISPSTLFPLHFTCAHVLLTSPFSPHAHTLLCLPTIASYASYGLLSWDLHPHHYILEASTLDIGQIFIATSYSFSHSSLSFFSLATLSLSKVIIVLVVDLSIVAQPTLLQD